MKKLTKREKLLIYLLACFLIGFFGIYFVVLPLILFILNSFMLFTLSVFSQIKHKHQNDK